MLRAVTIYLALSLAVSIFLFSPQSHAAEKPPAHRLLTFPSGTKINAEVADTPETRARGLMFRETLPPGGGMLFIFQEPRPQIFWMKNCQFPIDILWLDSEKKIIFVSEKTPPCKADPCPNYGPTDKNALYVIEVASGFFQKEKLALGMTVRF
ncbi:MAG: DUF192 domain-containing protein [Candidatus Manganitrophaceae bacterium]